MADFDNEGKRTMHFKESRKGRSVEVFKDFDNTERGNEVLVFVFFGRYGEVIIVSRNKLASSMMCACRTLTPISSPICGFSISFIKSLCLH